jgi:hypothetical protein
MRKFSLLTPALAIFVFVQPVRASTCTTTGSGVTSCTGSLASPEDFFLEPFTVSGAGPSTITIQTFGFGGGTHAAGNVTSPGGFDSLVALFSDPSETILTDGSGNSIASVPGTTQFFSGCPPAGTVLIGGSPISGTTHSKRPFAGDLYAAAVRRELRPIRCQSRTTNFLAALGWIRRPEWRYVSAPSSSYEGSIGAGFAWSQPADIRSSRLTFSFHTLENEQ